MKLVNLNGEQTNPYYNPATSNNGGGYWQSQGVAEWEMGDMPNIKLVICDDSCGDFGTRYYCRVTVGDINGVANWGTMYKEDEENTDVFELIDNKYPVNMWQIFWVTLDYIDKCAINWR